MNEMQPHISALLSFTMPVIIAYSLFSDFFFLISVQVVGVTIIPTMVQKYQSPVRVYKYPFELVMAVSVFTCTTLYPHEYCIPQMQSYVMLAGGHFRGHPQK